MNCKLWTTNSNCKTKYSESALEIVKKKKEAQGELS
jgi:hypothetical protein